MLIINALEEVRISNRKGPSFIIENPITCTNFSHLIGQDARITSASGAEYFGRIIGVERFAHAEPWWAGDKIALLMEALESKP